MGSLNLQWQLKAEDEGREEAPITAALFLPWNPDHVAGHRAKSKVSLPKIALVVSVPMNVSSAVFEH